MAMKNILASILFLLTSIAAYGQGVTVVLSNSVLTGITSALATNTPTAGQILQASDTTGVNNAWVTPVSGGGGGASTFGSTIYFRLDNRVIYKLFTG